MAVTTQWISVLGAAEDFVVEAFHHGRGVPYNAYRRFHAVMEEESRQTVVDGLMTHILPWVDGLTARLQAGIDVLDIACGSGRALLTMAEAFPQSRFTGIDISAEAISVGRAGANARGLKNVTLLQADAGSLWVEKTYHLITAFDAIHDQARPQRVLDRVHDALRPQGIFLMQDIGGRTRLADNMTNPLAPFNYTISCMHCMSVSLAGGGPGLGAMWGKEKALEMLGAAGFTDVRVDSLPHDPINYYYLATRTS
jgi:2-polyprenyl-3-methyl-5-hydroxy-6-metoxy-1,4-benzoquinol methylase